MRKLYVTFKKIHASLFFLSEAMVEVEFGITAVLAKLSMWVYAPLGNQIYMDAPYLKQFDTNQLKNI